MPSEAATVRIVVETVEFTKQPENVNTAAGKNVTFHVEATGEGTLSYQWQTRVNESSTWANTGFLGNKTDTLTVVSIAAGYDGRQYRCIVTDANGSVPSEAATVRIVSSFTVNEVTYEIISDTGVAVISYSGTAASLVIPEIVEGYTVTAIGEGAFENNTAITSIDLPDTITIIGKRAFKNCSNLRNMN